MTEPRTVKEWAERVLDHLRRTGLPREGRGCEALDAALRAYRLQAIQEMFEHVIHEIQTGYLGQYPDEDSLDDAFMRRQAVAILRLLQQNMLGGEEE